jgi:hypothetical protein
VSIAAPISERTPPIAETFDSEIRHEAARNRGMADFDADSSMDTRIRSAAAARGGSAFVPPRSLFHKRFSPEPIYSAAQEFVIDIPRRW